jgi:hypothetical protein
VPWTEAADMEDRIEV